MNLELLLTSFLVCLGAILISNSTFKSARFLKLLKDDSHHSTWRILFVFLLLFIVGYIISLVLLFSGNSENTALFGGFIFFFGACFISLIVRVTNNTLKELVDGKEALKQDKHYDALTGMPNRTHFSEYLMSEIHRKKRNSSYNFAVLFMDLLSFRSFNEVAGYSSGNKALQEIAARLRSHLRKNDMAARFGSDEFGMILSDIKDEQDTIRIIKRMKQSVEAPLSVDGNNLTPSLSVGVLINPVQYSHPDDVLRDAEMSMLQAKDKSEHISVLDENLQVLSLVDGEVEEELKDALVQSQFILHFQPIIDPLSARVVSAEALVRWNHPIRGLQPPMRFLSTARSSGLLVELGYWIFAEASRKALQASKKFGESFQIGINVSAVQFHQENFARKLLAILEEQEVDPSLIRLEINENILLDGSRDNRNKINELHEEGVEFSLDDFGTGLTSISGLRNYPIDTVKIHRSFVNDITRNAGALSVVQGSFDLAKANGLDVVAQGVETREQLKVLTNLGQLQLQGFFFSKATNFQQLLEFSTSQRVKSLL